MVMIEPKLSVRMPLEVGDRSHYPPKELKKVLNSIRRE